MGYCVTYTGVITIPKEKELDVFHAMRDLNKKDELKRGGSWSGGKQRAKWFSWMPENVDDWGKDCWEVLKSLGFEFDSDIEEREVRYDSKIGQENLFLEAIVSAGGSVYLECRGEDGSMWLLEGKDGKFNEKIGKMVYE